MKLPYRCLNEFEKELLRHKKRDKNLQIEFQKDKTYKDKEVIENKKDIHQNIKIFLIK